MSGLSPMMRHYLETKEKYKDCILFYRLGDFYEMFFEDAKEVSQLLDLTLTGRDCGLSERAPMCGVPFHAADTYIAKLVALGKKVAICEQLTEPTPGKGIVERDVIRVVSAGTLIEENLLDEKKNNYIACACMEGKECAIAWTDITTGEFYVRCFDGENAAEESLECLVKLSASEIICNDAYLFATKGAAAFRAMCRGRSRSGTQKKMFSNSSAARRLLPSVWTENRLPYLPAARCSNTCAKRRSMRCETLIPCAL